MSEEAVAEFIHFHSSGQCEVRLTDGREVRALLTKKAAREMFRILPGQRVRVVKLQSRLPRIIGFVNTSA